MLKLGMSFKINPTIKEINKYLSQIIEELLEKHGKVSSPEFDKELQERTGIAWKQVKNYRNHPKPGQRIRDNAKVLNFVLDCRKKDKGRKAKIGIIAGLGSAAGLLAFYFLAKLVLMPSETVVIIQQVADKQIEVRQIPDTTRLIVPEKNWVLAIGLPKLEQIDLSQFACKQYLPFVESCRYFGKTLDGSVEVNLTFRGDFLTGYSLSINELSGELPQRFFDQLSDYSFLDNKSNKKHDIGQGITLIESRTKGEDISLTVSKNGPNGAVNAVSISVSAKLWP